MVVTNILKEKDDFLNNSRTRVNEKMEVGSTML
jgi:hypothetical protein